MPNELSDDRIGEGSQKQIKKTKMKVIIDIDEDVYTRLFDNGTEEEAFDVNADDLCKILTSVRKGVLFSMSIEVVKEAVE